MECKSCGNEIQENWDSCPYCGDKIKRGLFSGLRSLFSGSPSAEEPEPREAIQASGLPDSPSEPEPAATQTRASGLTEEVRRSAASLAQSGDKIGAIKEYRLATGVGLKEAKDAVDYFVDHGRWRESPAEAFQESLPDSRLEFEAKPEPDAALDIGEIEKLARAGKKIEAIKEYRQAKNTGLKEAKDAVEYFNDHGRWR